MNRMRKDLAMVAAVKGYPLVLVMAVQSELSPVLGGGQPGPHPLQGIGAGFMPAILDRSLIDEAIPISKEEAFRYTALAAQKEGLFAGISTGASLAAVAKKLPGMAPGSRILTFCYDTGERYISVDGLFT